jgi:argininosuccinate lyase
VKKASEQGKDLSELSLVELQTFNAAITADVHACLTLEGSVAARNHTGGTAPNQVKFQAEQWLKQLIS